MPLATNQDPEQALYLALKQYTAEVRRDRRLPVPPARSVTLSSQDGSGTLTLDAIIEQSAVREIGYRVRACSLGQATTAILVRRASGLTQQELDRVRRQFESLLQSGQGQCDWPELEVFAPASVIPNRHDAALLPFRALGELFDPQRQDAAPGAKTEPL